MDQDYYREAIQRFDTLFNRAVEGPTQEPGAVVLATADGEGRPSARVVLLRGWDHRGFVFFTNSRSRKGQELTTNPEAALGFYWDFLGEQVRIEGSATRIEDKESDDYWLRRPRESRIGAWASKQSQPLANPAELDSEIETLKEKFANQEVPRPSHWFGYRIVPRRIEFWTEGTHRLHTRTIYQTTADDWDRFSVYP